MTLTAMTKKIDKDQPTSYKYKYKRLYDLGADRVAIIDSMLTSGDSTMSVVDRIQVDWKECTSVKVPTLDKQLQRYRKDIIEPRLLLAVERAEEAGVSISKGMKTFREHVDVIARLEEFVNMQGARIRSAYTKEKLKGKDGKLNPEINRELRPFTDMCRVLAGLQLETGVVRRVPRQVQGFLQQLDPSELKDFRVEMTTNDDTLKALNTLAQVIEEAAGEIIDGDYLPVTPQLETVPSLDADDVETESS